ncbi:hypothetical protein A2Z00_05820 [Candidatus Gottesmanbacteria bacterium RBG_13_45_10]|uniref:Uncharacterized protein n=1 Tax=Candidatus Gottesmanbacteria bacterium RBG_13_45_10 TaxID=1798370 RepID=A0A1F5ZI54_9BACT|nr:MAG: hypothetical protein A2Z00_05820 [Candidatus Gottesmanbacteria bacterium RBG_13_45_10]
MKRVHILHYLVLGAILIGGIATFIYVQSNTSIQFIVGIATAAAYVCWGLIHHALAGDLHEKIVVEYILIGAIAIVLLATVLGV